MARIAYSDELATRFCVLIAEGKTTREACHVPGMPKMPTLFEWLATHRFFADQYARAKEVQMEVLASEIREIPDAATPEEANLARLRVDSRKWLLSKLAPKKYGDRLELAGDQANPIAVQDVTVRFVRAAQQIAEQNPPTPLTGEDLAS